MATARTFDVLFAKEMETSLYQVGSRWYIQSLGKCSRTLWFKTNLGKS